MLPGSIEFFPESGTGVLESKFGRLISCRRPEIVPTWHQDTGTIQCRDNWAVLNLSGDIQEYYAHQVFKKFGIKLTTKNLYGPHISIIRGENVVGDISVIDGRNMTFKYTHDIFTNGNHWWLNVDCPEIENIRSQFGLSSTPGFLHLTIGRY